jgi:hypothetical protein
MPHHFLVPLEPNGSQDNYCVVDEDGCPLTMFARFVWFSLAPTQFTIAGHMASKQKS